MAVEAYIPTEATYEGEPISNVIVLTLYDPDSDESYAALTTRSPLAAGTRGGPLIVTGGRAGKNWRVCLPEIEVVNKTALGCELRVRGSVRRSLITDE